MARFKGILPHISFSFLLACTAAGAVIFGPGVDALRAETTRAEAPRVVQPRADSTSTNSFFPNNWVNNPLDDAAPEAAVAEYKYYPEKPVLPPEEVAPNPRQQPQAMMQEISGQAPSRVPQRPTSAEDVVAQYGNPDEAAPVLAQDNAPLPFKGMQAALEVGDDQLAFRYAKQWVRHMQNVQTRIDKLTAFTDLAREKMGMTEQASPSAEQYRYLVEGNLGKAGKSADMDALLAGADPKMLDMIEKAKAEEAAKLPEMNTGTQLVMDDPSREEREARAYLRKGIEQRIQPDPKGKVDIYFFFKPEDPSAAAMVPVLNALFRQSKSDSRLHVVGMVMSKISSAKLVDFADQSKVQFPMIPGGEKLAENLKLTKFPSTVFITATSNKVYVEEGVKQFYYFDELVKVLQGRK